MEINTAKAGGSTSSIAEIAYHGRGRLANRQKRACFVLNYLGIDAVYTV